MSKEDDQLIKYRGVNEAHITKLANPLYKGNHIEITLTSGCPVMCTYCPQSNYIEGYKDLNTDKKNMSIEDYKIILDNIDLVNCVAFTGFTEPLLNKEWYEIIKHTINNGWRSVLNTTLFKVTSEDVDKMVGLDIPINIHFTDSKLKFEEKIYREFGSKYKGELRFGYYNEKGKSLIPVSFGGAKGTLQDRGGNLNKEQAPQTPVRKGPVVCTTMRQYSNVVLPNGDVSVCCSDFGLKHILGNLLTTKLSDIHKSEKMKDFNRKMDDGDENFICNRCSYSRLMRPEDEDNLSVWYRLHPNEETGEGEWDQTRSQIFEPDMSDGQHQYDHPNGKVWWIYSCKDKKFVGKFERYRIDGITECIGEFDENGEKHGKWIGFYHTGEQEYEENYKNGIREGFYRKWFYDGIVEFEGNYKNGKEDGTWNYGIPFPSDGKIMRKRKNYKNGKLNGIYEEWHPNGKIWKEYQYINDNKNSEWKEWYNNGNLKFKIQFKNNKMHGDYSEYHVNGLLRGKGKMKNNRMEGKWNFWFHNNIVEAEISCNNGRIISGKSFNDNGTIKKGREELWDDNSIKPSWI